MRFFRWLVYALYSLFIGWLVGLIRLLDECVERKSHKDRVRDEGGRYTHCQVIPPDIYKRPDPLIYSQPYLMSLGLGVTWDNPDIQLFEVATGNPVPSSSLKKDTDYEVRATIYNGSNAAPAVGMAVDFSFLSFGIATVKHPIGTDVVDLPVNGAAGHPATASHVWHTPDEEGHYCLQVNLLWADDANPNNNLGQENTNVGTAQSPAVFEFPVRNENVVRAVIHLAADGYAIPSREPCDRELQERLERVLESGSDDDRKDARRAWCAPRAQRHDAKLFPVPAGWTVAIEPNDFPLDAGATQNVKVTVTPPDTFHGVLPLNVNAFDQNGQLLGGVTLYTQR
jgi:hypothetical protein